MANIEEKFKNEISYKQQMIEKYGLNVPKGWYGFDGIPDGWKPLINKLIEDLIALGWDKELHQCKSKYGGLRFYIGSTNSELESRIDKAESDSCKMCEICSSPATTGSLPNSYWTYSMCKKHWDRLAEIAASDGAMYKIYEET